MYIPLFSFQAVLPWILDTHFKPYMVVIDGMEIEAMILEGSSSMPHQCSVVLSGSGDIITGKSAHVRQLW